MSARLPDPDRNRLLNLMPAASLSRLQRYLTPVRLPIGPLSSGGAEHSLVHFPIDSVVALVHVMDDGSWSETAVVGNEGLVGITHVLGGGPTRLWPYVQHGGYAYAIDHARVQQEFHHTPAFHDILLRYTQALLMQMTQIAACNRYHTIDQQLCRWLLLSLDRLAGDELRITQETIARLLGVRREGVTAAAGHLQREGIIQCRRGHIVVSDRPRLEAHCCECYRAVREQYAQLLPAREETAARTLSPAANRDSIAP